MKKYKAIFFDLDHTLWDFEANSRTAISELFHTHNLNSFGIASSDDFIKIYKEVNTKMWDEYHRNLINKEHLRYGRFERALSHFGVQKRELTERLSTEYLDICPVKTILLPGAIKVLELLKQNHSLHIITNGFKEVQYLKIRNSGLMPYFDHIHISEEIGFKKPEPEIFNYACKQARAVSEECIMIGDNLETDIAGARNANVDHIFFNPEKIMHNADVNLEIAHLEELLPLFTNK